MSYRPAGEGGRLRCPAPVLVPEPEPPRLVPEELPPPIFELGIGSEQGALMQILAPPTAEAVEGNAATRTARTRAAPRTFFMTFSFSFKTVLVAVFVFRFPCDSPV